VRVALYQGGGSIISEFAICMYTEREREVFYLTALSNAKNVR
jgi:hypothetical protein